MQYLLYSVQYLYILRNIDIFAYPAQHLLYSVQYFYIWCSIYKSCTVFIISCAVFICPAWYLYMYILHSIYYILRSINISGAVFIIFCAVFIYLVQYLHIVRICFVLRQTAPHNFKRVTMRASRISNAFVSP